MRSIIEPETLEELIRDCAQIPQDLCARTTIPTPPAPRTWTVDEVYTQYADLEPYA